MFQKIRIYGLGAALVLVFSNAIAQAGATETGLIAAPSLSFKQAFEAAWLRQPELLSQPLREQSAQAQQSAAQRWSAESATLSLAQKSDRWNKNQGNREWSLGLSVPLWLPGERSGSRALAEAQMQTTSHALKAAQLRSAASVYAAYWQWQRALTRYSLAATQFELVQQLARDVAKRVMAGDLARADQHQADGVLASAEVDLAEAQQAQTAATQQLSALIGFMPPLKIAEPSSTESSAVNASDGNLDAHPLLAELANLADVAQRNAALVALQTRANPELSLATNRERGAIGEAYQQNITLGISIALGSGARNIAQSRRAQAEALEAQERLNLERGRLQSELTIAQMRVTTARTQYSASNKRWQLAQESRQFFDQSFRMGETDLPTRIRIELEAIEAQSQAEILCIEMGAARAALRQAQGLLPK